MEYNEDYKYAVALKDRAQGIGNAKKGDILKKITSWMLLRNGTIGWTVTTNEFEYFNSMGEAEECQNRLIGNINSKSIKIGDYIVWNSNSIGRSPGEMDMVIESVNNIDCITLKKYKSFDTRRLTDKDKEANWFPTYEEAQRYSKVVRNQSRTKVLRVAQKDESLHDFKIGDEVKCIDVVTDFEDCGDTSNGHTEWRRSDKINIGDILTIKNIEKTGIRFYGKSYKHSPSAFVKVNVTKQDSDKPVQEFIKGQWYKSFMFSDTMAKFSHIEGDYWVGSEWITDKDIYRKERFTCNIFNNTRPISIEEVSPYLPEGHPDKIKTMELKENDLIEGELYKYDNTHLVVYPDGPSLSIKGKIFNIKNHWHWNLNIKIPTPEEKQLFQDYLNRYYKLKYEANHIEMEDPKESTRFPETGKLLYKTNKKKNKKLFRNTVKVKI